MIFPRLWGVCYPSVPDASNACSLACPGKAFSSSPCKPSNSKARIARLSANHLAGCWIASLSLVRMRKDVHVYFMNYFRSIWGIKNCRELYLARVFTI